MKTKKDLQDSALQRGLIFLQQMREGKTQSQIAKENGISRQRVSAILQAAGYKTKPVKDKSPALTRKQKKAITRLAGENIYTHKQIAKKVKSTVNQVRYYLSKTGQKKSYNLHDLYPLSKRQYKFYVDGAIASKLNKMHPKEQTLWIRKAIHKFTPRLIGGELEPIKNTNVERLYIYIPASTEELIKDISVVNRNRIFKAAIAAQAKLDFNS